MNVLRWDLIVVGAGPAGLASGIFGPRKGLKTLILDEKMSGGSVLGAPLIENYPGFEKGVKGMDLAKGISDQAKATGARIHELEKVIELALESDEKKVKTEKAEYGSSAIIIASGTHPRKLDVPGEKEFYGKGVSYCAVCDGAFFRRKKVIVVGNDRRAACCAIHLSDLAANVGIVCQKGSLDMEKALEEALRNRKVDVFCHTELREIKGGPLVGKAVLSDGNSGETREIEVDGIFFEMEGIPNSRIARDAGVKIDEGGYIITDERYRTNIKGVYAAGSVTSNGVKYVVEACAEGTKAAIEAALYVG